MATNVTSSDLRKMAQSLFDTAPDAYAVVAFNMDGSQSDYKGYQTVAEADDAYGKLTDNPAPWVYVFEADRTIKDESDIANEYLRNEGYFVATNVQTNVVTHETTSTPSAPPMQGGLAVDMTPPHVEPPIEAPKPVEKSTGGSIWPILLGLGAAAGIGIAIAKRHR